MTDLSVRMAGRRLTYRELTADCGKEPCRLWTPILRGLPNGSSRGERKAAARPQDRRCLATQKNAIRTIWKAAWSNSMPCGRSPHSQEYNNPQRIWSRIQQLTYLRRIMPVCRICMRERRRTNPNSRFAVTVFKWVTPPFEAPMPATICQLDQRRPVANDQAGAHRECPCLLRIV